MSQIRNINVVGTSGSGKTTVATRIAQALNLRLIEMDALYGKPNWAEPDDAEYFEKLKRC